MKKLLCGFLCVSAGALLATEVTVATVDVIAVDSGLKNTIVAIPGLDLAGGNLAISNLVKTTGLTPGDKLYAFSNNEYETWELDSDRHWTKASKRYTISSSGVGEIGSTDASIMRMDVGSGIWLSRTGSLESPFYIYAAHAEATTNTVAAGATVLLGNPKTSAAEPIGAAVGDQILVPTATVLKPYTWKGSSEGWKTINSTLTADGGIRAGTGFWYKSNGSSEVKITW